MQSVKWEMSPSLQGVTAQIDSGFLDSKGRKIGFWIWIKTAPITEKDAPSNWKYRHEKFIQGKKILGCAQITRNGELFGASQMDDLFLSVEDAKEKLLASVEKRIKRIAAEPNRQPNHWNYKKENSRQF